MRTIRVRTFDEPGRMVAGSRSAAARTRDTILNENFRITPDTRILPEPAPEVSPGELGVLLTGNAGSAPRQVDIDTLVKALEDDGTISAAEIAKIKATYAKFSGRTAGPTQSAGVTSNDARDVIRQLLRAQDAMTSARIQSMSAVANDFWDKRYEETKKAIGM